MYRLCCGCEAAARDKSYSINDEEVIKELAPETEKSYEGAITLWHSFAKDWEASGGESPSLDSFKWPKRFVDEITMGTDGRLGIEEPSAYLELTLEGTNAGKAIIIIKLDMPQPEPCRE